MTPSDASAAPRARRHLGRWLGGIALVLVVLLAAVVIFRTELASRAARAWLESRDVPVRSLVVTRLTPGGVELRDVVLGEAGELSARSITLTPAFEGLEPALREAAIDGLRLRLDLREGEPLLGSLQPALGRFMAEAEGGADAEPGEPPAATPLPAKLEKVSLDDAQVIVETPSGPMTAVLGGNLAAAADDGGQLAAFTATLDSELGRLRAELTGRRARDGSFTAEAQLAEGRLGWRGFAVDAFSGSLALGQAPAAGPQVEADVALQGLSYRSPQGAALELAEGRLTASGGLADFTLTLDLAGEQEALELALNAQSMTAGDRRDLDFSLEAEARSAGGLAQFVPLPGPRLTAGTAVLLAEGSASLPGTSDMPRSWQAMLERLPESRLTLDGDAVVAEVALADGSEGISGHLALLAEVTEGELRLGLSQDSAVRVERPSRRSLHGLGVPDDVLPLVASGLSLTLQAGGDQPFRLVATPIWPPRDIGIAVAAQAASDQGLDLSATVEGSGELGADGALRRFDGTLDSTLAMERLTLGGREAQGIRLALPLAAAFDAAGLRLTLARPGRLDLRQFGRGAPLRLDAPLAFSVRELALESTQDPAGYRYRLQAAEDGAAFAIARAEAEPLAIEAGALTLQLDGRFIEGEGHDAALEAGLAGLALPDYAFTAEGAEVTVALDAELRPRSSRFDIAALQLGGEAGDAKAWTAPLQLAGSLDRAGNGYYVAADLTLAGGQKLAEIAARYGDDGALLAEVRGERLSFSPDGLQPGAISPRLDILQEVTGSLSAEGSFAWPRDPAAEAASLTLGDLSFRSQGATVEGLELALRLTELLPPASPPAQRLTIRRLEAGVPVETVALAFSVDAAPRPQLTIGDGSFVFGGAPWRIEATTIEPAAARNRFVLATDSLDLAAFFELVGVDGLSGSGTLAGRLPIVFAGGDIIVEESRFEAQGPGRLSIRFEALRSALASGGETVEMAAQALEDFRYDNLSLTLAKTAEHDATVRLSTLGRNPEVLDGQPFQFNINLESNLTSVLEALRQGYSLSDDALRRAWRLNQ